VVYTVGDSTLVVPTTSVTVSAPTASPNNNMRVMDTTTKLYYSTDNGATYTEVTTAASGTWTSIGNAESCISFLNSTNKAFNLRCTDPTKYAASTTWKMKYVTSFTQVSGLPATPSTREDVFNLSIYNKCYSDVLQ